jgi:hypothetical protein
MVAMKSEWTDNINYSYLKRYLQYCHLAELRRDDNDYPSTLFVRMTNYNDVKYFINNVDQTAATKVGYI